MSRYPQDLRMSHYLDVLKDPFTHSPVKDTYRSLPIRSICLVIFIFWLTWVIIRTLIKAYATPLQDVPGPWIAKFTRFWLFRAIVSRKWHKINIALHKKYGPIVRISPNEYSIDDPKAVNIIYRARDELQKSERYSAWGVPNTEANIFTERDIERYSQRRKQVNALYLKSVISNMENPVDRSTIHFFERLNEFAGKEEVIEICDWLHHFAFDTIGGLAFGKPFGFLETGSDIRDIQYAIHTYSRYGAIVGVFCEWHPFIFRALITLAPSQNTCLAYVLDFIAQSIKELGKQEHEYKEGENDILSSLFAKHQKTPEKFTMSDIYYHTFANVAAGAETTGITLSAIVYFLWKNPQTLAKLRKELESKKAGGRFSHLVTIKEAAECPYLQAVIKEALRLHPGNGLALTRAVPKDGLTISGRYFPEGTEIGISAFVAHANTSVFGADAETFRPERWLDADPATLKRMEGYFMTFGRGPRSCLGKHVSLMEIQKLIPELVMRYDLEFEQPQREWVVYNDWFVKQEGVLVRVRRRETADSKEKKDG